jgi:hypothetical protein
MITGPQAAGSRVRLFAVLVAAILAPCVAGAALASTPPIRAAYVYDYMDASHIDSLAAARFNRMLMRMMGDSLDSARVTQLGIRVERGRQLGVEVVPDWPLQSRKRLEALGSRRRYTWGIGNVESGVACPLDSLYWRSALLDRAEEVLSSVPGIQRLAIDLETHSAGVTHYDAGACRCVECVFEYTRDRDAATRGRDRWRLSGLMSFEEARLTRILAGVLAEFKTRHPAVELGVLDLDLDSFVHRSLARALAQNGISCADYSERSYSVGGSPLWSARDRLKALGLPDAPLIGGLWLRRFAPSEVAGAVRSVLSASDGYFIFTTYSLWREPSLLFGPYLLLGRPADYWTVLTQVNGAP